MPLTPDTQLSVELGAICGRNRFTHNPAPVIAQLLAAGAHRPEVLAQACGSWAGYYDSPDTHMLAVALIEGIPGAAEHVNAGRAARGRPVHGTG